MTEQTLQQKLDSVGNVVDFLRNQQTGPNVYPGVPAEYSNWRNEQRAWAKTAVLFNQSYHMPHSAQFHLTERIHLSAEDPDVLVNEMLMEDPEALEEPFAVTVRYRRDRHGALIEFQCAENDRNPVDEEGNTEFL